MGEAPTETSQNLYAPELAPSDKRIETYHKQLQELTKQLNEIKNQVKKIMKVCLVFWKRKAIPKYKIEEI